MDLSFHKLKTASKSPLWNFPQPSANSVAMGVLVFAGTRDEHWPKEAGIAHALEHMHFEGTKKFPTSGKVAGYIEEVGGRLNAWTSKEMTFYHVHIPAEQTRRGVEILGQQLGASTIPDSKIRIEMQNIVQEIRRRNDAPSQRVYKIHETLVYGQHPLGKDTLGTEESVSAFNRDDFLNFKNRYYNSKNMVFVTAGKIDDAAAVDLFDEFFPALPGVINERYAVELSDSGAKISIEKKDIEQVHLILSAIGGKAASRDSSLLELFGFMISGGMSFPLFQDVRDKRGLCYEIHGGLYKGSDISNFNIYVGTDPKRYKEAIEAVLEVIQKSKSDADLLERAKTLRIGRFALNYENMAGVINFSASDIIFLGKPRGYEQIKSEIEEVTIEDIEKVVDNYLLKEKLSQAMLVPQGFQE